ncbi:hypothetical protein BJ741DRAFT_619790 [Chytriomyces cf. hyalinus JEL632]|nr:hypothetical protein BJ741DRAFT_619790 [Chytriomyces cf. hyalinus JEL632]
MVFTSGTIAKSGSDTKVNTPLPRCDSAGDLDPTTRVQSQASLEVEASSAPPDLQQQEIPNASTPLLSTVPVLVESLDAEDTDQPSNFRRIKAVRMNLNLLGLEEPAPFIDIQDAATATEHLHRVKAVSRQLNNLAPLPPFPLESCAASSLLLSDKEKEDLVVHVLDYGFEAVHKKRENATRVCGDVVSASFVLSEQVWFFFM